MTDADQEDARTRSILIDLEQETPGVGIEIAADLIRTLRAILTIVVMDGSRAAPAAVSEVLLDSEELFETAAFLEDEEVAARFVAAAEAAIAPRYDLAAEGTDEEADRIAEAYDHHAAARREAIQDGTEILAKDLDSRIRVEERRGAHDIRPSA